MKIDTVTIHLTWKLDGDLWGWRDYIDDLGPSPAIDEIKAALIEMAKDDPIGMGLLDSPDEGGAVWSVTFD